MADQDLRRLIANSRVEELLTQTECEILRRAARGNGLQGIANLYGFGSAAAAGREVDRIRAKLEAAVNGRPAPAGGSGAAEQRSEPRIDDSSQAAAQPDGDASTPAGKGPSHKDRIVGYLRDHAAATPVQIARHLHISMNSIGSLMGELERSQLVRKTGEKDGRSWLYQLLEPTAEPPHTVNGYPADQPPAPREPEREAPERPEVADPPRPGLSFADVVNFAEIAELARAEITRIEADQKLLRPLQALLQAAEDCAAL